MIWFHLQRSLYYPDYPISNSAAHTVPMESTPLYTEDRIGLRTLKKTGRLHLLEVDGRHLEMSDEEYRNMIITKYLNGSL